MIALNVSEPGVKSPQYPLNGKWFQTGLHIFNEPVDLRGNRRPRTLIGFHFLDSSFYWDTFSLL